MAEEDKCSNEEHFDIDATAYCSKCRKLLCIGCEQSHKENNPNHKLFRLDNTLDKEILCKEANHNEELKYYCKTHNILCCCKCTTLKDEENGQHYECQKYKIKDIEKEKRNNLEENLETLDALYPKIEDSISNLKAIFKLINENKENFKSKIKHIFSEITDIINNRKDELIKEIDNKFEILYFKEDIVKESENLPDRIKSLLEEGMNAKSNWDDNKLIILINTCLKIENIIKEINIINDKLNKYEKENYELKFIPKEEEIQKFKEKLKTFGKVDYNNLKNENNEEDKDEEDIKDIEEYSYQCIKNNNSLVTEIYEGTNEAVIDIMLKNTGKCVWTRFNTKLICDNNSKIVGNEIKLGPQNPGEKRQYKAIFKNVNKLSVGEYNIFLLFLANGNPLEEKLGVKIVIKDIKIAIKHLRDKFQLSEDEYSDEMVGEELKENNFNEENTFSELIDKINI